MKSEYQQLRDILDAVRYPVDARHEADFRAILLGEKKRERRNVIWFFLCCAGMLMAGYGIVSSLGDFPAAKRFFGTDSTQESSTFRSPPSQENAAISIEQQDTESIELESQVSENTNTDTQHEGTGEGRDEGSFGSHSSNSNNSTRSQESVTLNTKSKKHNKQSTENIRKSSTQAAETSGENQSPSQQTHSISDALEPVSKQLGISDITEEEQRLRALQGKNQQSTQVTHDDELLNTTASELSIDDRKVSEKTIIPSERRIHFNKVHYGVSAALFPVGSLLKKSTLKTGYGYQIGGYATYRMTPRTLLRADAGFSRLNGGFTYIKQSSSQQFGFSVVNKNHTLEVEKLYTAYASGEIGVKRGKNVFCLGVLGQYLYGARGDIESSEQGQTETPVVTVSNDVWLSTKDINKFSLQGTVSVRSHLTRRLQIAGTVRIPILHTVRIPGDNLLYAFQVKSHGISPQISMSYQINQQ